MTKDQRLIELSCKEFLMNVVKESEILNEKLSFFQKTLLYDKIREMPYNEVLSLIINNGEKITTEQKREFESKAKSAAMYAGGAYLGRKAGLRIVGGKPVTFLGKTLIKGKGVGARNYGLMGTKGGIRGILGGVAAIFLYRKLSDSCVRKNLGNKQGQLSCRMEAIKKVIGQLNTQLGKCATSNNPTKCKSKIQNEITKWQTKYQELNIQYSKKFRK